VKLARILPIALTLLAAVAAAPAADKLEDVEKQLIEKWKGLTSLSAKIAMDVEMKQGEMAMKAKMTGTTEYLRHEGKHLTHLDATMDMEGGQGQKSTMTMQSYSDGEVTYMMREFMGMKSCVKQNANAGDYGWDEKYFEKMSKDNKLTLGEDAECDGQKCWVIVAERKAPQPGEPAKAAHYFRQSDGVHVKLEGMDAEGTKILTATYTDIKINPKLEPSHFEFKAPEGVQVVDQTTTSTTKP